MKFILMGLVKSFTKEMGRSPNVGELKLLRREADIIQQQDKIIQFPTDRITNPFKTRPQTPKIKQNLKDNPVKESIDPKRIKGGISTKIKLNSFRENQQYVKDLIGGKSKEFNTLKSKDRKEILDQLEAQIKKDTNPIGPPIDPNDMPFAAGGLAGLLGEEPRSEYSGGGGTGAPPITYDDNVDNIGPGSSNRGKLPRLNVMPEDYYSEGTGTGVMIDPRGFKDGKLQIPTQGLANGGRIGFKKGSKKSFGSKAKDFLLGNPDAIKFFGGLDAMDQIHILLGLPGLYADGGRAGYSRGMLVKGLGSLIDYGRRKFLKTTGAAAAGAVGAKTGLFGFKKATPKAVEDIKITMGNEFDGDMDADGMQYGITQAYQYLTPLTKKGKQIYNDLIKKKKISKDGNITDSEDAAMIVDDLIKNKKIKLKIGVDDASYQANKKASQTFTSETADQIKNNALAKASGLTDDFGGYGPTKFVDEFHEEIVEMVAPKIAISRAVKKVKDGITTRLKNMYDARNRKQLGGLANLLGE